MIRVGLRQDTRGRIRYLCCSGHAGFDAGGSVDLVCAGVSAITGVLVIGLTEVAEAPVSIEARDGFVRVKVPARLDGKLADQVQFLMQVIVKSLDSLSEAYPGFIKMRWLKSL